MANAFADWMISEDGGQKVITNFEKGGSDLYTGAPKGLDPLAKVSGLLKPL